MRWIVAVVVFVLALASGAPFFGALFLAALGWGITHLFRRSLDDAASPPVVTADSPQRTASEENDISVHDSIALRAYLRRLTDRVAYLETEVEALRRGQPTTVRPQETKTEPAPVASPPRPVVEPPKVATAPSSPTPQFSPPTPPVVERPSAPPPPPQQQPKPEPQPIAARTASAPPPPPPPTPAAPKEPGFFHRLVSENIVAKVGAIILFFGVGFLLKYAYDRGMIRPELRLLAVGLAAAGVFYAGWKLRLGARRLYGLILQGVASGLAYLDVFFALKTYYFISVPAGFACFAALGVATTLLAVRQDAKPLAFLGLTGAFMAPILASTGGGNVVFLFSYYLLLNLFVLAVSWFKAWRILNLSGWFFSLAVAAIWGARSYTPALFWSIEPFLLAFFAIYLVIPILFATRQPPELKGLVDGTLVFGTPAAVAVIQASLVWDMPYGLAWSSAVGALLYALLWTMVIRRPNMELLAQTYIALALGLGTLAIFYAFGAYTTFALWSIEGAAILWVCLRQKQFAGRLFGIGVQVAGAVYFALDYAGYVRANPWFNDAVLGCAIITTASLISAAMLRRYRGEIRTLERSLEALLVLWAALWWSIGGIDAITHGVTDAGYWAAALGLYFTASFLACELAATRLAWTPLRCLTAAQPLVLIACAFLQFNRGTAPLGELGWLAWPAAFISAFWILHRQRRDNFVVDVPVRYGATWLVLAFVATWQEMHYVLHEQWISTMALAVVACIAAGVRYSLRERSAEALPMSSIPLAWGTVFWYLGGIGEVHSKIAYAHEPAALIAFVAASALIAEWIGRATTWRGLRATSGLLPLMLAGVALLQFSRHTHPLEGYASVAWLAGLAAELHILHRQRADGFTVLLDLRYGVTWLLLGVLATWEAAWWIARGEYLYAMALGLAGYGFAAARFRMSEIGRERWPLSTAALLWSMVFWFAGGWLWIGQHLALIDQLRAMMLLTVISAVVYEFSYRMLQWPAMRVAALLPWTSMPLTLLLQFAADRHTAPLADAWALSWLAGIGVAAYFMWREEKENRFVGTIVRHAILLYLPLALLTWHLHSVLGDRLFGGMWLTCAFAAPSGLALLGILALRGSGTWPLNHHWPLYRDQILFPVVFGLAAWALIANVLAPGGLQPLSIYLPLLNPLDLTVALVTFGVIAWIRSLEDVQDLRRLWQALGLLAFLWANAAALRCIHYWYDIPYRFADLAGSVVVQAVLSILWTSAALTLMLLSRRYLQRKLWIAGAALLAVVVAKLFLVDLANTGTVERIVSFLGVGVILLIIGYLAPVPPGVDGGKTEEEPDRVTR